MEVLRKAYPEGIDRATVISIFFQYYKTDDIYASLEYLADKEYVLKKEHPHPFIRQEKIQWYRLAHKGIDLLDGNLPDDPGILIPRGQ